MFPNIPLMSECAVRLQIPGQLSPDPITQTLIPLFHLSPNPNLKTGAASGGWQGGIAPLWLWASPPLFFCLSAQSQNDNTPTPPPPPHTHTLSAFFRAGAVLSETFCHFAPPPMQTPWCRPCLKMYLGGDCPVGKCPDTECGLFLQPRN